LKYAGLLMFVSDGGSLRYLTENEKKPHSQTHNVKFNCVYRV
jgi:hypothetical protein